MKFSVKNLIAGLIATVLVYAGISYLALPALAFTYGQIATIGISALVGFVVTLVAYEINDEGSILPTGFGGVSLLAVILFVGCLFSSCGAFHEDDIKNSIQVSYAAPEATYTELTNVEEIDTVSFMDTASVKKLVDRCMGKLPTDKVGQYEVRDVYRFKYNGNDYAVAPLHHAGFFKAMKNETIIGYSIVDCGAKKADLVLLDEEMVISPSCYGKNDLMRFARTSYPSELFVEADITFQLDEDGNQYWTIPTYHYVAGMGTPVTDGIIIINATTKEHTKYALEEIPEWVDNVITGDTARERYNHAMDYINGWWNLEEVGETVTTDDYGYLITGNNLEFLTGVTSKASDESNTGFVKVDSRTTQYTVYELPSVEEYSAMEAAEGIVQNFGYVASFPTIVVVDTEPAYVMVLKDANGLVKQYAMVNYSNQNIAVVANTIEECIVLYVQKLEENGIYVDIEVPTISKPQEDNLVTEEITVERIEMVVVENNTVVYVFATNGKVYKQAFSKNESWILVNEGDVVTVTYKPSNSAIISLR